MMNLDFIKEKNNTSSETLGNKGINYTYTSVQPLLLPVCCSLLSFICSRVTALLSVSEADSNSLCLWLARTSVQSNQPHSLAFPNAWDETLLLVGEDELIVDVFKRLTLESFTGCPVVDSLGVYINQVDMLDIVFFVCRLFKARQYTPHTLSSGSTCPLLSSVPVLSYLLFPWLCRLR